RPGGGGGGRGRGEGGGGDRGAGQGEQPHQGLGAAGQHGQGDQGQGEGDGVGQGEGGDHRPLGAVAADAPVPHSGDPGPQRPEDPTLGVGRGGGHHGGAGLEPGQRLPPAT